MQRGRCRRLRLRCHAERPRRGLEAISQGRTGCTNEHEQHDRTGRCEHTTRDDSPLKCMFKVSSCAVIDRDLGDPRTHTFPESTSRGGLGACGASLVRPSGDQPGPCARSRRAHAMLSIPLTLIRRHASLLRETLPASPLLPSRALLRHDHVRDSRAGRALVHRACSWER